MEAKEKSIIAKIKKNIAPIIFVIIIAILLFIGIVPDELREMAPPIDFETVNFGEHSWLVLERQEDRMLLLSEYILFEMAYSSRRNINTWEDSSLREYLNHDFFYAFTQEERALIIPVINGNPGNPRFNTYGGSDTEDLVFILSLEEILKYFGNSGEMRSDLINDIYNERRRTRDLNGNLVRAWWVRTPGSENRRAVFVSQSGSGSSRGTLQVGGGQSTPMSPGTIVTSSDVGVRPAMWVAVDGF